MNHLLYSFFLVRQTFLKLGSISNAMQSRKKYRLENHAVSL